LKLLKTKLLFIFLLAISIGHAQNMTINATVVDTNAKTIVKNAVGMVIRVRDSVLLDFKRTDKMGQFNFSVPIDTVEFIIKHPEYGDYRSFIFGSKENNVFEMNPLPMPELSSEIEEVVIFAYKDPIYYRGDTLVYVADSFKVKENAVVEDLLKKLPGMSVDANGKITNQGKEIGKVLVDGDEFFGSDPTIATKNLAANGVDQVQVYEKDAEDGSDEKIQVLDLKLKEEAKKGYFGKVNLAGGVNQLKAPNSGFYESEVLLNKYNKDQKMAVFGLASNTPKTNFGFGDLFKYGIAEGRNWMNESDDQQSYSDNGDNNSEGIPQTIKTGFYIDQKAWKGARVRLNYTYSQYDVTAGSQSLSQYILTDTTYTTDVNNTNQEGYKQHAIGLKFTQQLDSLSRIEFEPKINISNTQINSKSFTNFIAENDSLTRTTDINNLTTSEGLSANTTLRYFKDFKKKNRKLQARYNLVSTNNSADGTLNTIDKDAVTGNTNPFGTFDQKKENRNVTMAHTAYINYVEPIAKKWKTEFDYEYYKNANDQRKTSLNPISGEYVEVDSLFSNQFSSDRQQQRAGAFLIYENSKGRISFGSRVRNISIANYNFFSDTTINQTQTNFLPRVVMTYKFTQSSRLRIQYNTNSSLPSVDQLQPVRDNSNPNFVQIGNPDIKPNYAHSLNVNYNMWSGLSGFYVYGGLSYSRQNNAFSTSTTFNANGTTISKSINVDHADYLYYWGGVGLPFKKVKDLKLNVNLNGNLTSSENYINFLKNETKNLGIGTDLTLEYNGDSLNLELGGGIDFNKPTNTLSTFSNQPYTNYNFSGRIDWTLPYRWFFKTDATYNINTGRTAGYNINYVIWNMSVNRSFLKTGNLLFGIEAYDILNQNVSNYRTVNNNVIVDQKTNIIRRYFMAKMTLKFNNNKTKEVEDDHWF
jgi:hypothetical protein